MTDEKRSKGRYDQTSIKIKKGIEHVRARPAMYIGDVYERGLHHMVSEVVDNSVDEAMAGHCTEINVTLHQDGSITILDNGRGIPVEIHPKEGKPTLEVCLTILGAGGKFDKDSYKVSGGLHGVGVSCVNALSEWLEAEVYRDGKEYRMRFERGVTTHKLEEVGATQRRGTKITFLPDSEIFKKSIAFEFKTIANRLRELCYLNAGLKVVLTDERTEEDEEDVVDVYHFPNGLVDFVDYLATSEDNLLRKPIYLSGKAPSEDSGGTVEVEIAIQYQDTYSETLVSYTNNINTVEGGTHLTGFRTALTSSLNSFVSKKGNEKFLKGMKDRPSGDDYREGLIAVISVKVPEPQFEGQTKTKLGNSDVAGIVQAVAGEYLRSWCELNSREAQKIVKKAVQACKARVAARKARQKVRMEKDSLGGGGVAKLKTCESNNPEECELYLVEGDSAGGTANDARNPRTQAILPLRGKILNVWKATHEKMLSHNEIATMIMVLGTGVLAEFDLKKLKYHKIVIMCDADVDGSHIRTLILTFFFRQMPELISAGHIYLAQPPLFKISPKGRKKKKGEHEDAHSTYFITKEEFETHMLERGLENAGLTRTEGEDAKIEGETLQELIATVQGILRRGKDVEKKTKRPFDKFLAKAKDGKLPFARIRQPKLKKSIAAYSEEELDEALKTARAEHPDLKVWSDTDPLSEREGADVEITRFESAKKLLEAALEKLSAHGLTWSDCYPVPHQVGEPIVYPFTVHRGKDSQKVRSLGDVAETLRDLGSKGLEVQRYKGLGEMDAEELESTTMMPGNRVLLQVTLEDMAEANKIFSTLMGSKVEPRREYIAKHASKVAAEDVDA